MKWNTDIIQNWIDGKWIPYQDASLFMNHNPHNAEVLQKVVSSGADQISNAVVSARKAQSTWASFTPVKRGDFLRELSLLMQANRDELAHILHLFRS